MNEKIQDGNELTGSMDGHSAILEPFAIQSILTYLGLPDKPPELMPAQIPEQRQFA